MPATIDETLYPEEGAVGPLESDETDAGAASRALGTRTGPARSRFASRFATGFFTPLAPSRTRGVGLRLDPLLGGLSPPGPIGTQDGPRAFSLGAEPGRGSLLGANAWPLRGLTASHSLDNDLLGGVRRLSALSGGVSSSSTSTSSSAAAALTATSTASVASALAASSGSSSTAGKMALTGALEGGSFVWEHNGCPRCIGGPVRAVHVGDRISDEVVSFSFYPGSGRDDVVPARVFNAPLMPLWRDKASSRGGGNGSAASGAGANGRSGGATLGLPSATAPSAPSPTLIASGGGPPLSGRFAFRDAVERRLLPLLMSFGPDLIFISAGFDGGIHDAGNCHNDTGECGMNLRPEDFEWITQQILAVSRRCCPGRVVSVLEGGYGQWAEEKPTATTGAKATIGTRSRRGASTEAATGGGGGSGGGGVDGLPPRPGSTEPSPSESSVPESRFVLKREAFADNVIAHLRALTGLA